MTIPVAVCHEFVLVVDRHPADQEWDWLADVTHDAHWSRTDDDRPQVAFDRDGRDLAEAIGSAIRDLNTAGFVAAEVRPVELLLDIEVCDRVNRSWPWINAKVEQSPVAHPKPLKDDIGYYRWSEVAAWLAAHGVPQAYDQTIEAANRVLKEVYGAKWGGGSEIADHIRRMVRKMNPWQMPGWMEPYRSFIADTGGNDVGWLIDRLDTEPRLTLTNLPVATLAMGVWQQVRLLERLHAANLLPDDPGCDGGWGR